MITENPSPEHKRRVRYKGANPRNFSEKYKELQPEKYAETVAKVIGRGSTPAGMHRSICVSEILDFLQIQPGQIGLDATLGYGGHTAELLKQLGGTGHIFALDADPIELVKTRARLEALGYGGERLTVVHQNFADVEQIAPRSGPLNFALADLGLSSMQIDNPDRGFTFKREGPLDLRLNPEKGVSAAERLKTVTQAELEGLLRENADEPNAEAIAKAILAARKKGRPLATTTQLRQVISDRFATLPADTRDEAIKKSCQRTFQALRIDVNREFEVLYQFLEKIPALLAPGGRLAILTFHSGEDRLVKGAFKHFLSDGTYREISDGVLRPSAEECAANPRARSAKLRWAIKA